MTSGEAVERVLFESAITPIVRTHPARLMEYARKVLTTPGDCSSCPHRFLVRERGLTRENVVIYVRMLRILGRNLRGHYCYGRDDEGYVFCYDRDSLPLIFETHVSVFSRIADVGFSVGKCHGNRQALYEMTARRGEENQRFWNSIVQGVLALKNTYQRTGLSSSRDILVAQYGHENVAIFLHGHQLKDFLRGRRPEQSAPGDMRLKEPAVIYLGHYHRLGVFRIPHCEGVICLGGSITFGPYLNLSEYHPEILSEMGFIKTRHNDDGLHFEVSRRRINLGQFREWRNEVLAAPPSIEARIEAVREQLRQGYKFVLPGNHDPMDEIYVHSSIAGRIPHGTLPQVESVANGDYAEFSQPELRIAKEMFTKMLVDEGYIPLGSGT